MDVYGWIQFVLFVGILLALTKPMGLYLFRILGTAASRRTYKKEISRAR